MAPLRVLDGSSGTQELMFEEVVIYVLMLLLGLPVVVTRLLHGEAFDGGATTCLLMTAIGVVGLVRLGRVRKPVVARALPRRDRDLI